MQSIPLYEILYTEISFSFAQIYIAVSILCEWHVSGCHKATTPEEYRCEPIHRFLLDNTWKTEHIYMSKNN